MKCPQCPHANPTAATECEKCNVILADAQRNRRRSEQPDEIDRYCPFNDHGQVCGKYGTCSPSTDGSGPWYCSEHWGKLRYPA